MARGAETRLDSGHPLKARLTRAADIVGVECKGEGNGDHGKFLGPAAEEWGCRFLRWKRPLEERVLGDGANLDVHVQRFFLCRNSVSPD